MLSTRGMAVGLWLLLMVAWNVNVEAFPVATESDSADISDLEVAQGINREEMRQKEKTAVARDIKELQLVEHLIDQKRGGRPPVATVTRAQDTTEIIEPHLGENDEPVENMAGEQPPKIEDFEDKSNFDKRESEGNPFMPAAKLVKAEENVTVTSQKVFKGPHADIDRHVRKQTKTTYKEVFGTANEAKHKMDQIAKDSAELKAESERELKILDIKMPKGPGSAKRKPTSDDPFADAIPDHVMGAHDGAKRPELNFNGAGSGGRSKVGKSSMTSGHGGNRYAHQHMQNIQDNAMASMPGGHTSQEENAALLGETAGIAAHGHTAGMAAKVKAAYKKMVTPPGDALTMQAVKLEEEDIVRIDKNQPAAKTVKDLDKFLHMEHVQRNQHRRAWMAAKEGEAKKLYQIKQDRAKQREVKMANRNKGPQMPADVLARKEADREHAVELANANGGKGLKKGGKGGKGHRKGGKGGKGHAQLRESNPTTQPIQGKINNVVAANGKAPSGGAQQAPAQRDQTVPDNSKTTDSSAEQSGTQQDGAQQANSQSSLPTVTHPDTGKTYSYDPSQTPKKSSSGAQQTSGQQQQSGQQQSEQKEQSSERQHGQTIPVEEHKDWQPKQSNQAPATQAPAAEAPAAQAPAAQAPAAQAPAAEAPAKEEAPAAQAPAAQAPAKEEAPAAQAPAAQAPAKEEAPAAQAPAAQAPAAQAPAAQAPAAQAPAKEEAPAAQAPASQDQASAGQQQSNRQQSDQQQAQASSDDQQQQQADATTDKESREQQQTANAQSQAPQQTSGHKSGDSETAIEEQRPSKDELAAAMSQYGPGGKACNDCT